MQTGGSCAAGVGASRGQRLGAAGEPRHARGTRAARPARCLLAGDAWKALQLPTGTCHMLTARTPERLQGWGESGWEEREENEDQKGEETEDGEGKDMQEQVKPQLLQVLPNFSRFPGGHTFPRPRLPGRPHPTREATPCPKATPPLGRPHLPEATPYQGDHTFPRLCPTKDATPFSRPHPIRETTPSRGHPFWKPLLHTQAWGEHLSKLKVISAFLLSHPQAPFLPQSHTVP